MCTDAMHVDTVNYISLAILSVNAHIPPSAQSHQISLVRYIFFKCKLITAFFVFFSLYHKPVSAVSSKRRRSSCSGPSKMEDLPKQEDKRSLSKSNKK